FSTFGVPVLRGRPITADDRGGAPRVAVVSEAFGRRFFKNVDPIGRHIRLGPGANRDWLTIVGVMPTLYTANLDNPWQPEVLTSYWQDAGGATASVAVRGDQHVANVATIRSVVTS